MTAAEPKYKDRLFSFLFGNEEHKDWTLSLYNAVNGSNYTDAEQISITTIRQVLYLGMHNDVSFMISGEMNMYEQQSTYNPNMPLRMLQYAGNLYEKDITLRELNKYGKALIELAVPKLVVFYNGTDAEPDERMLRLSDAFPEAKRQAADIEVRVRLININKGHSARVMAACKPLNEYAWTVDRVRLLERDVGLDAAIDQTIDDMPNDYIIKPFMEAHRAEVKSMLLTEYNETKQMELFKEDGRREGRQEGKKLFGQLVTKLLALGRIDDVAKAGSDPEYLDKLFAEFKIE